MEQLIHRRKEFKGAIALQFLGGLILCCKESEIDIKKQEAIKLNKTLVAQGLTADKPTK